MTISKIINDIIKVEGGYVNDPDDPGGETNYGITYNVARENGYIGEMIDMPVSIAYDIYYKQYVKAPKFDLILEHSELIAEELIDTGVNCGVRTSSKFLQEVLNQFNNNNQKYYSDLVVDGYIGHATITALTSFLTTRGKEGEQLLFFTLNCRQVSYYSSLNKEKYIYGWIKHRAFHQVKEKI